MGIPSKNIIIFLLALSCSAQSPAQDKICAKKLDNSGKLSKKCLEDYLFLKTIVENTPEKPSTIFDKINKKPCFEVAVSTADECQAVGWSNDEFAEQFCSHPEARQRLEYSALKSCQNKGCKCKIVISNSKVRDQELLAKFEDLFQSRQQAEMAKKIGMSHEDNTSIGVKPPEPKDSKKTESLIATDKERSQETLGNRKKIQISVAYTQPNVDGDFFISINTKGNVASIKIDDEQVALNQNNNYLIQKIARAGQSTTFQIVAKDFDGNSDTKTITVSRPLADSKSVAASLNPAQVKRQPERDAVAVIIGIADYKNLPRADYANDDARVFYDYAIRALGVKPENIRLLVDADADQAEIYRAFKTWLPSRVRATTDVYVYYSGHGLPTADGQGLYVLPQRADRDFMDKTAITQAEINAAIQAAKPKSVTIFLDACYSGQARTGETLLASARPVTLKSETAAFPDGFTVITASRGDQISSSSPELKHGIFSYFLMKGMEGDADANRDGRITAGEIQAYLAENVARQAGMMNRRQEPQLIGDANRLLVGR